jgi:2-phosphosulfolactate phosphatase
MYFDQQSYDIRCDWGLAGLTHLSPSSDAIVIIDVLSFSTCVDIAVANGGDRLSVPMARHFCRRIRCLTRGHCGLTPTGYGLFPLTGFATPYSSRHSPRLTLPEWLLSVSINRSRSHICRLPTQC